MITTSVTLNLRTAEALAQAKQAVLDATTEIFENEITPEAKALAPVLKQKTTERWPGELRDSIESKVYQSPWGAEARITTNCGYGGYVERGTVHMKAEPYINPAFELHIGKLPDLVKEKLSE